MKIYTRTGDAGETSLFDRTRVSKADARVDAYGDVDELNACLGVARAAVGPGDLDDALELVQRELLAVGSRLADPASRVAGRVTRAAVTDAAIARLEETIDRFEAELAPLRRFILPGGGPAAAQLHLARTVCRRAERRVVALGSGMVGSLVLVYLNRLSDLLFVAARLANHRAGIADVEW